MIRLAGSSKPVTIDRVAVALDIERIEKRKPDKLDRNNLRRGMLVLVRDHTGRRLVCHVNRLGADGPHEIQEALLRAQAQQTREERHSEVQSTLEDLGVDHTPRVWSMIWRICQRVW